MTPHDHMSISYNKTHKTSRNMRWKGVKVKEDGRGPGVCQCCMRQLGVASGNVGYGRVVRDRIACERVLPDQVV